MNQLIVAEKKRYPITSLFYPAQFVERQSVEQAACPREATTFLFYPAQFVERQSVEQAACPREATRDCRATDLGRIVAALETQHKRIRGFWGRQSRRRGVGKDDSAQPVLGKR